MTKLEAEARKWAYAPERNDAPWGRDEEAKAFIAGAEWMRSREVEMVHALARLTDDPTYAHKLQKLAVVLGAVGSAQVGTEEERPCPR